MKFTRRNLLKTAPLGLLAFFPFLKKRGEEGSNRSPEGNSWIAEEGGTSVPWWVGRPEPEKVYAPEFILPSGEKQYTMIVRTPGFQEEGESLSQARMRLRGEHFRALEDSILHSRFGKEERGYLACRRSRGLIQQGYEEWSKEGERRPFKIVSLGDRWIREFIFSQGEVTKIEFLSEFAPILL